MCRFLPIVPPPHRNYQQDFPWLATEVGPSCKICILNQISPKLPASLLPDPLVGNISRGRSGPRCAEMPNGQHHHSSSSAASSTLCGVKPQSPVWEQDKKHLTLKGLQHNGVKPQLQSASSSSSQTKGERTPLFRNLQSKDSEIITHKKRFQVLQTSWFSSEPLVRPAGSYWVCMFS